VAYATLAPQAEVVNRFVSHTGFSGSGTPPDNAIDTVTVLAKEGSGPTALSEANLINTSRGVNGVVFDIQNLGDGGALSAADFEVQVSPQGAFDAGANPPAGWAAGPAPSSVTVVAGSPDRVRIEWPNGSITNRWLRITVKANANTGLASPESYYVGHLLGETTGLAGSVYTVAFADITPIRSAAGSTVDASSIADIDKNGTVSFADITAMRSNVGAQLTTLPFLSPLRATLTASTARCFCSELFLFYNAVQAQQGLFITPELCALLRQSPYPAKPLHPPSSPLAIPLGTWPTATATATAFLPSPGRPEVARWTLPSAERKADFSDFLSRSA
jgi:hypothetical protein